MFKSNRKTFQAFYSYNILIYFIIILKYHFTFYICSFQYKVHLPQGTQRFFRDKWLQTVLWKFILTSQIYVLFLKTSLLGSSFQIPI